MVEVVIPAGMKPWAGGDCAPADWDGGEVLLSTGYLMPLKRNLDEFWRPEDDSILARVIAYTPRADAKVSEPSTIPAAVSFMRHDGLCAVVGGYDGYGCTCGMEAARDAILATLRSGGEVREAGAMESEVELLRQALIAMGRMLPGVFLDDRVSSSFLANLPREMEHYSFTRAALAPAGGEG